MSGRQAAVASAALPEHIGEKAAIAGTPGRTTLDALVEPFVSAIERGFPQRFKTRPKTLKRRVQYLIRVKLPPRPRPAGRTPRLHISRAPEMYRQQRREVEQGKRAAVGSCIFSVRIKEAGVRARSSDG